MSSASTRRQLEDAKTKLASTKIKERAEGLALVRSALDSARAVASYGAGDGATWLELLQALFGCVDIELSAIHKATTKSAQTSSAAGSRRLGDAGAAVRWLIERAAHRFNRKTAACALKHLSRRISEGDNLCMPLALDYTKAARAILRHAAHAENLDPLVWVKLAEIAWNTVLGRLLRVPLDDPGEEDAPMDEDGSEPDEEPAFGSAKRGRRGGSQQPAKRARVAASLEEIELNALLATLHSLPSAPLSTPEDDGADARADALFRAHAAFLARHAPDASLHTDHLLALSGTLARLSLNRALQTRDFARRVWRALLALWVPKNRALCGALLPVLRALYPYYVGGEGEAEGLVALAALMDGDRAGDALGIEGIRLRLGGERGAFEERTFGRAAGLDAAGAGAWAMVEMQADCAARLLATTQLDTTATPTPATPRTPHQRRRDPLEALLASRPPALLFFVARHWPAQPPRVRSRLKEHLLSAIAEPDERGAWAFLALAAIADAPGEPADEELWGAVWSTALRRLPAPAPGLSRAAAHAAHAVLAHALVPAPAVQAALAGLARELASPGAGPPAARDAVCAFLGECVRRARGDAKLFRAGLGEAVGGWVVQGEVLRRGGWSVRDVLRVCAGVCGVEWEGNEGQDGEGDEGLPVCAIVEQVVASERERGVREFVLEARVPDFVPAKARAGRGGQKETGAAVVKVEGGGWRGEEKAPGARERKVSTALLQFVEGIQSSHDPASYASTARVCAAFDAAVLAASFEALLAHNNIKPNSSVLAAAAALLQSYAPLLRDPSWTASETAEVLRTLLPLVHSPQTTRSAPGDAPWAVMGGPSPQTGIARETLRELGVDTTSNATGARDAGALQRILWARAEMSDALSALSDALQALLARALASPADAAAPGRLADEDGFGPIRASSLAAAPSESQLLAPGGGTDGGVLRLAVRLLAQAGAGGALTDALLGADDAPFLRALPAYAAHVRSGALVPSADALDALVEKAGGVLQQPAYAKHAPLITTLAALLDGALGVWLAPGFSEDTRAKYVELMQHLGEQLAAGTWCDWRIRDALGAFFARYVAADPREDAWYAEAGDEDEEEEAPLPPFRLIMQLNRDDDVRVRARVAGPSAELLLLENRYGTDAMTVYEDVKDNLTVHLTNHEHMLTRFLTLGNAVVVCAKVARGPFWHLLETCLYTPAFDAHAQAVFAAIAARMGLVHHRLFELYASQVAWSLAVDYPVQEAAQDFLNISPAVLGYTDARALAKASFRAFAPAYLYSETGGAALAAGRARFARHCAAFGMPLADGIREAFADVAASDAVYCVVNQQPNNADGRLRVLFEGWAGGALDAAARLREVLDAVFVALLRRMGGQDPDALHAVAQARFPERSLPTLIAHVFRFCPEADTTRTYAPNLPLEPAEVIFDALDGVTARAGARALNVATSYHVMHRLVADIHAQPLVNEQLRLAGALAFWAAKHYRHFREPMLLQALAHAASLLLARADLARVAQGLLGFAFTLYNPQDKDTRSPPKSDERLCDVLVRVCGIAHGYVTAGDTQLGNALTQWLHHEVEQLLTLSNTREQALRALVAWPHELPAPLEAKLRQAQDSNAGGGDALSLSSMLADPRIAANKFRIVRRLAAAAAPDAGRFARLDFWRLKECIPSRGHVTPADAKAFSELLFMHAGAIQGFGTQPLSPQVERHQPSRVRREGAGGVPDHNEIDHPERVILEYLLCALDSPDPRQVQAAYAVLRTSPTTLPALAKWDPEFATEWAYFVAAPHPAREATPYELRRLSELRPLAHDFGPWVSALAAALCGAIAGASEGQYAFFAQLQPLVRVDAASAAQVLPVLVHTLLRHSHGAGEARKHLSAFFADVLAAPDTAIPTLHAIVRTALHMRNFYPPDASKSKDMQANEHWFELDRMLLSRAALRCGAYTTALLFYELASEQQSATPNEAEDAEDILFAIYSHIDEPDGFYGIQTRDMHRFLLRRLQHERQWDRAFMFHGAEFEAGAGAASGVRDALHAFGFNQLAQSVDSGVAGEGVNYALAWRTEAWDLPDIATEEDVDAGLYRALRAVHQGQGPPPVENALGDALERLRGLADEDLTGIREVIRGVLCVSQVGAWCAPLLQKDLAAREIKPGHWKDFLSIGDAFEFETTEQIIATRMSLLSAVRRQAQDAQIGDRPTPFTTSLAALEKQCLVRISAAARDSGALQIALNSVVRAQRLEGVDRSSIVAQEFANVLWDKGEHKLAIEFLRKIVHTLPAQAAGASASTEKAVLLSRLGSWSSEACMEKPAVIWETYFQQAIDHLETHTNTLSKDVSALTASARIFHECALFADRHYHALSRSPEILRRKIYVDRKQLEIRDLEAQARRATLSREDASALTKARKLLKDDMQVYEQHVESQRAFLYQAVVFYARSLAQSSLFDDEAHVRLVSIWYANFDDDELARRLGKALDSVPSHKFVFLAHQLTARLAKADPPAPSASSRRASKVHEPSVAPASVSQDVLQHLVLRMCEEHPFHTVYQLYSIRPPGGQGRRISARHQSQGQSASQGARAAAAGDIFSRLRQGQAAQRVSDIEKICDASLAWATERIKDWAKGKQSQKLKVPAHITLLKVAQQVKVPIPTARTPIDVTGRYDRCVLLTAYEDTFGVAGGINLPKIHGCLGSDGQRYVQLFKGEGEDDMRQDAVMEQVFDILNIALRHDRETRRRNLHVRTYSVLPLAEQAGMLEFVQNTKPLGDVLASLHKRYRPKDISDRAFADGLRDTRDKYGGTPVAQLNRKMLETWKNLKQRLQPVMHHWFTEEHKVPMSWFAMRLNYSRSVATTSIIGHILGLGDRHTKNILLDKSTGEAVHIDLGIAFDQGKLLPVPELVPFRMTRDMVDGLGTAGTQGVFQRCAEETLRVLRADREVVLTVLEVFKYDPLHSWAASDSRLTRIQDQPPPAPGVTNHAMTLLGGVTLDMNSGGAEEAADRALSAVARKLDGTLSVEHTVNELIQEASGDENLSMMYFGWSPYY